MPSSHPPGTPQKACDSPNTGQRKILRTFDNADLGKVLPGVNRIHLKLRKDDRGRDAPLACDEDFEDTPYPTCVNSILQLIHAHQHSADVRQPSPEHLEEVFRLFRQAFFQHTKLIVDKDTLPNVHTGATVALVSRLTSRQCRHDLMLVPPSRQSLQHGLKFIPPGP